MNTITEKLNSIEEVIEVAIKNGSLDANSIGALVAELTEVTNILSPNKEFIDNIDEFNEYLNEMLSAMQNGDLLLLSDVYKYKLKELLLEY